MKKLLVIALGIALAPSAFAANEALKTIDQKASYTLASDLAKNFTEQGLNIDAKAFMLGLEDSLNNRPPQLSEEEMMAAISAVKKDLLKKQAAKIKAKGVSNLKAGQAFLADNAKKPGVTTLDSGVQYKVITAGKGSSPTAEDTIFAHYEGKLIDGTVFDSSYKRGKPLKFKTSNVIKGWGEALTKMKPGAKWEIYIPSDMAYGERGAGKLIGPNEALTFTVELISFIPDEK